MSPQLPDYLRDRATSDQVLRLHRRILFLIWVIVISMVPHAWSAYDRIFRIHPDQERVEHLVEANGERIKTLEARFGAMMRWMALMQDKLGVLPPKSLRDGE